MVRRARGFMYPGGQAPVKIPPCVCGATVEGDEGNDQLPTIMLFLDR